MVSRGICGQRGFPKLVLAGKITGNSILVAVNPANPSYRPIGWTAPLASSLSAAHPIPVVE